jgi:hypothetical protein
MTLALSSDPQDHLETIPASDSAILPDLYSLLPIPHIDLTPSESQVLEKYQLGRTVFGPVASTVMTCPPPLSPEVLESLQSANGSMTMLSMLAKRGCCPYAKSCPLLKQGKAPHSEPCPLETTYIIERFVRWSRELGSEPYSMTETERITASDLTQIDLYEHRSLSILGEAENARLTDLSVKEVATNGDPLAYEKVIHINLQSLEGGRAQRRKILHDFELTPEMKTKKAKYESGEKGVDLSSLQSARADKFKDYRNGQSKQVPTTPPTA